MLGEQSLREYRSGDPEPEAHCTECGVALYEGEYVVTQADEAFCLDCDAEGASRPLVYRRTELGYYPLQHKAPKP